ncbi:MAG: gamma carbonic anhydrase family protein [Steroidobacteraceae bacterium]
MNIRPFRNIQPQIGARTYIDPSAVVIGRVTIGEDVSVWPCTAIRGDVNTIHIGARTNIQDGSILHVCSPYPENPAGLPLIIGEDVTVGHGVILHACTVGNFSLIGMGATVLDGATLEDHVFIGAGALVTPGKRLAARGLYMGSPARRVRELTEQELVELHESAAHYVELKNEYL